MNRTEKEQIVQELAQRLAETPAAFLADYRGINVEQATALRRELTQAGVEYRCCQEQPAQTCCTGNSGGRPAGFLRWSDGYRHGRRRSGRPG